MSDFVPFQKIPRRKRGCVITEKLEQFKAAVFAAAEWNALAPVGMTSAQRKKEARIHQAVEDAEAALTAEPKELAWYDGEPPKPWRNEWFIARTIHGDRVVLKALPEDFTYDYKTADETYIMARNIAQWMQFPDSVYLDYAAPQPEGELTSETNSAN